jgi:hypothetical protein
MWGGDGDDVAVGADTVFRSPSRHVTRTPPKKPPPPPVPR